jgi:hypothetical protein
MPPCGAGRVGVGGVLVGAFRGGILLAEEGREVPLG